MMPCRDPCPGPFGMFWHRAPAHDKSTRRRRREALHREGRRKRPLGRPREEEQIAPIGYMACQRLPLLRFLPPCFAKLVHHASATRCFMRRRGNGGVFPENVCARTGIRRVSAARRRNVVDQQAPVELVITLE